MLRDLTINKERAFQAMFPFNMKVTYSRTWVDTSLPLDRQQEVTERFVLGEVPCSVQSAVAANEGVLDNEYVILSPCLDMTPLTSVTLPEDATESYNLEVQMNGKTNHARGEEILSIDSHEIFRLHDLPIGCKIKVRITGRNWTW